MKKINEFKVHYPSLRQLMDLSYTDPRVDYDGKKIYSEKNGVFIDGDRTHQGKYIVYKDMAMPGKFVGIFASDSLKEDDENEKPFVHVIAVDNNIKKVNRRVNYRKNKHQQVSEAFSTMRTGEYLEFEYGRYKNDQKPDLLVFYDDGNQYIEGINANYLSYQYIKKLNDIIDRYPGIKGRDLYAVVVRTAYPAVQMGYRKYFRNHVNPI